MADSTKRQEIKTELHRFDAIFSQSSVIEEGTTTTNLKPRTDSRDQFEFYRKIIFGDRDTDKLHKNILLVGETGIGKTKLINSMINYMLGVKREDKIWFEITDDQSDRSSAHSQTSIITVYGFYLQESQIQLTIIDTPGYGNTHGIDLDKQIDLSLLSLCKSAKEIKEIDAVCLVIKATQTRLSDRQIYIFDAVQSLFGSDIAENIVLLLTHSRGSIPKGVLEAVKVAKIKCAVNDKNKPVYFLFDNCQSEPADEENEMLKQSWNLSFREIKDFFIFLKNIKAKPLKLTQDVLEQRKQLEQYVSNIQSQIQKTDPKQNQLKQTLEQLKRVEDNKDFEYEDDVFYKERVDIDPALASVAMCCTVCEENCHYPGCWWISSVSWCIVMKNDHCTVCTNKCHYSKHVKSAKIYVTKKKKEKRTNKDLKKQYYDNITKFRDDVSKLKEDLQKLETEKVKLVIEAFHCVETLENIALNTDSLITLLYVDFIIEKLKEINDPEKAEKLENIKKRAGEEKNRALGYVKKYVKSEN